jgi:hypothetical protein
MSPIDDKDVEKIHYVKVRHNPAPHRAARSLKPRQAAPER